jgi:hypothetical protein
MASRAMIVLVDSKVVAPLVVTVLVALAGFIATYLNNMSLAQRKDRLDRVSRQLSELYGPLFAMVSASTRSWTAFRMRYRPTVKAYWDPSTPPTKAEEEAWRLWMRHVFMPLNTRMEELVITKADLLDAPTMPDCLLQLVAHVAAYRAFIAQWDEGDFSQQVSLINFPNPELLEYAERAFVKLKREQQDLLGALSGRNGASRSGWHAGPGVRPRGWDSRSAS